MKSKTTLAAAVLFILAIFAAIYTNKDKSQESIPGKTTNTPEHSNTQTPGASNARNVRNSATSTPDTKEDWAAKIDEVLGEESKTHVETARSLLSIVISDKAPLIVRNDALEHSLNLISDKDFNLVLNLVDTGQNELPESLVQTILDDTLNRTEDIQLNTALRAMQGSHTKVTDEARELLEFHLDLEHGDNIHQWQKAVNSYIAKQKSEKPQ